MELAPQGVPRVVAAVPDDRGGLAVAASAAGHVEGLDACRDSSGLTRDAGRRRRCLGGPIGHRAPVTEPATERPARRPAARSTG